MKNKIDFIILYFFLSTTIMLKGNTEKKDKMEVKEYLAVYIDKKGAKKPLGVGKKWTKEKADEIVKSFRVNTTINDFERWIGVCSSVDMKANQKKVLDIDENMSLEDAYKKFPFLVNTQCTPGNRKGWHFYIRTDLQHTKDVIECWKDCKGDLISRCVWEHVDKPLYNEGVFNEVPKEVLTKHMNEKAKKQLEPQKMLKKRKHAQLSTSSEILEAINAGLLDDASKTYDTWVKCGFGFYNDFGDEGFVYFNAMSQRCPEKYDEDDVKKKWDDLQIEFTGNKITMGFVKHIMKTKDATIYDRIFKEIDLLDSSEYNTWDTATVFKLMFGDKFLRCRNIPYFFGGVYWNKDEDHHVLTGFITTDFLNNLEKQKDDKIQCLKTTGNCEDEIKQVIVKFQRICQECKNCNKRQGLVQDILTQVTNNEIEFDTKPQLFTFKNAQFDILQKTQVKPNPHHYVSQCAGYDFPPGDVNTEEIKLLFTQIFPDAKLRHFAEWVMSTALHGEMEQQFFVFNGSGANGKSMLFAACKNMLGDYSYELNPNILTKPIQTGANPELANLDNVRSVFVEEPKHNAEICTSLIKNLTGNTTLPVRGLYSKNTVCRNKASLLAGCNTKPKLDECDEAMQRRIKIIPCESKFLQPHEYEERKYEPNVFLADKYFTSIEFKEKSRIPLFWYLMTAFQKTMPPVPDVCQYATTLYMESADDLCNWIQENYEKSETDKVSIKDMFEHFKQGTLYSFMSKKDKKDLNFNNFKEKMERSPSLKHFVKQRDDYFHKERLTKIYFCGWKQCEDRSDETMDGI